jgi:regulator of sigma E protease
MDFLIKAAQLFLSLAILVTLHEFGHFIPAKLFKTRIEKFYLFFNPFFSVFRRKKVNGLTKTAWFTKDSPKEWKEDPNTTEWGFGWLPLGGYVKIAGMIDESMDTEQLKQPAQEWEFRSKKAWQRLIIMVGGVVVNLVLGFIIYIGVVFTNGIETSEFGAWIKCTSISRKIPLDFRR